MQLDPGALSAVGSSEERTMAACNMERHYIYCKVLSLIFPGDLE